MRIHYRKTIFLTALTFAILTALIPPASASPLNISYGIEISEIMYDPPVSDSGGEWVEIYNGSGGILDLSRFVFSDNGGASFKSITQLPGYASINLIPDGAFAVISEPAGTVDFSALYPDFSLYVGITNSAMSLLNTGEEIVLRDTIDGIKDNGNDITLQDFIYPDNTSDNSIIKLFILSGDETIPSAFAGSTSTLFGAGMGNPGKLNAGQMITAKPVPEAGTGILFALGVAAFLGWKSSRRRA